MAAEGGNPWRGSGRFVADDRRADRHRADWERERQNAFVRDEERPSSWDRTVSYWRGNVRETPAPHGRPAVPGTEEQDRRLWTRGDDTWRERSERKECGSPQAGRRHTGHVRRRYGDTVDGYEFPPDSSIRKRVDPVYAGTEHESQALPAEVVASARKYPPPSVTGAFRQPGASGNGRWESPPSPYPSDGYDGGGRYERDGYAVDRRLPVSPHVGSRWQAPWPVPFVAPLPGRGGWNNSWSYP